MEKRIKNEIVIIVIALAISVLAGLDIKAAERGEAMPDKDIETDAEIISEDGILPEIKGVRITTNNPISEFCGHNLVEYNVEEQPPLVHIVEYDANGGIGAPDSQTKTEGSILILSGTQPSKEGFTFKCWTASIGGDYYPKDRYNCDQDGGIVTMCANWNDETAPSCSSLQAVLSNKSTENGTVSFVAQDMGSGMLSVTMSRYSYAYGTWSTINTWTYNGTTESVSGNYTETQEGKYSYKLTFIDVAGNVSEKISDIICIEHVRQNVNYEIPKDIPVDDIQSAVVSYALSKVGCPYDQSKRTSGTSFDCSSLAYYAWQAAGVDISFGSGYPPTAAEEARLLTQSGCSLGTMDLQPGDLVFYGGKANGRYLGIYHVAIYTGEGMAVEALNVSRGVVYQKLRTTDVVMVCRPKV